MDMFDGVGRRRDQISGQLVNIGNNSLNGNESNCLFRNNGDGTFSDVGYVNRADRAEDGRGLSVLDFNLDGHLDLVLRNYEQPAQLLRNSAGSGHWLALKLVGSRSNRDAVGARVILRIGAQQQIREVHAGSAYLSGSSLTQHFGLGASERVDSLTVFWPSGGQTVLTDLPVNQQITVEEGKRFNEPARGVGRVPRRAGPSAER
jgi:hypothetical protein